MSEENLSNGHDSAGADRTPQVGALLRASRTRVGEDLRDVSDILCIRYLYLEAIEDCRYEDLPGETYAVGFIRSYAEHLGLDGEEVVRRFRAEQSGTQRANDLSFPTPVPESGIPKGAIVFVGVIIALLIYGGWYATTTDEDFFSDLISPVPERLKHLVGGGEAESKDGEQTSSSSDAGTSETGSAGSETQTTTSVAETVEAARQDAEAMAEQVKDAAEQAATAAIEASSNTDPQNDTPDVSENEQVDQAEVPSAESAAETTEPITEVTSEAVAETEQVAEQVVEQVAEAVEETTPAVEQVNQIAQTQSDETRATESAVGEPVAAVAAEIGVAEDGNQLDADTAAETATQVVSEITPETAQAPVEVVEVAPLENLSSSDVVEETEPAPIEDVSETADTVSAEIADQAQQLQQSDGIPPQQPASAEVTSELAAVEVPSTGIFIRATDSSWVEITNPATQTVVFTGVMSAGATFDVPDQNGLLLDTGNAGVLDIFVNGESVPKIGGVGAVRKGVTLDPANLIAGTATDR